MARSHNSSQRIAIAQQLRSRSLEIRAWRGFCAIRIDARSVASFSLRSTAGSRFDGRDLKEAKALLDGLAT